MDRKSGWVRVWLSATLVVTVLVCSPAASAATITVTTTMDDASASAGTPACSLTEAIIAANRDVARGGCPAGDPGVQNRIVLQPGATYTLTQPDQPEGGFFDRGPWYGPNAFPPIASSIAIEGNGATIARLSPGAPFRIFVVGANPSNPDTQGYASPGPGVLTLDDLTLTGGFAKGGDSNGGGGGAGLGGAIFNQGVVVIERSTLTGNTATGGAANNAAAGNGGGGIGSDSPVSGNGGGFGAGNFGGGAGGAVVSFTKGGGGGAGFGASESGNSPTSTGAGTGGGGPLTGLGGPGGATTGASGGDGSGGGGGLETVGGNGGANGGAFGSGGSPGSGSAGGGAVGGGGGGIDDSGGNGGAGGGGFGGGGGSGNASGSGGTGGFGGGGGAGAAAGGFGGLGGGVGTGGATPAGGGGAGMGGAIFNMQGQLTIRNSTLTANRAIAGADNVPVHATALGGAVFNLNGSFTAVGSTFASNTAANDGTSIYNLVYDAAKARTAQTTLRNTIVARGMGPVDLAANKPAGVTGGSNNSGGSSTAAVGEFDLVQTMAAREGGTILGSPLTADPLLGPLQSNGGPTETMTPAAGSPVVDGGSAFGLTTDQRGLPRPSDFASIANTGDGSDIGAVELQAPAAPPGGGGGGQGALPTKASISGLGETNKTFAVGPASTPLTGRAAARRHKKGTVFSFRLDQPAMVKIAIQTKARGRRVGRSCKPDSRRLRHKPRCTRIITIATLTRTAHAGLNMVAFSGRIRGKALKPGRYQAAFTAIDAAGTSAPKTLSFTIVKR